MISMLNAKREIKILHPLHFIATGFGSGMLPWMPGTFGSMVSVLIWYFLILTSLQIYLVTVIVSFCLGVYCCHLTAKDMGVHDHGCIVWDEFVGIWVSFIPLIKENDWHLVLVGFLIFRFLDIWKPWIISWCDRKIKGGIGMMVDDAVAGIICASILYCIKHSNIVFTNLTP